MFYIMAPLKKRTLTKNFVKAFFITCFSPTAAKRKAAHGRNRRLLWSQNFSAEYADLGHLKSRNKKRTLVLKTLHPFFLKSILSSLLG